MTYLERAFVKVLFNRLEEGVGIQDNQVGADHTGLIIGASTDAASRRVE